MKVVSDNKNPRMPKGRIFSSVRLFYEQAVSDLDTQRSMHRPEAVFLVVCNPPMNKL